MKTFNAKELKESASLLELLSQLGYQPKRKSGKEQMFYSMLRDNDHTPSFAVDDKSGEWYDHGIGEGGNIIDFGLKFWPNDTFKEVVTKINGYLSHTLHSTAGDQRADQRKAKKSPKIPTYIITSVKPLGTHPAITEYLQSRGVFEIGLSMLSEVYYTVKGEDKVSKHFYSAGWKNDNGSWEVRNKYFKGCLGTKEVTTIAGDPKKVSMFEGFMNYLSWKSENPSANHTIIILNTLSLLAEGIEKAKRFTEINMYFDRDAGGHAASKELLAKLPYAIDRSAIYEKFNDYNDRLIFTLKDSKESGILEPVIKRGTRR
ncbi:toprim domain-containing protein [Mucilaginibacter lappiensis]|uniref:toprim domain-containing protein n=1 Tax=Mucilaginibacter lappiensis TaxID=354630 RepID=UPI003D1F0419